MSEDLEGNNLFYDRTGGFHHLNGCSNRGQTHHTQYHTHHKYTPYAVTHRNLYHTCTHTPTTHNICTQRHTYTYTQVTNHTVTNALINTHAHTTHSLTHAHVLYTHVCTQNTQLYTLCTCATHIVTHMYNTCMLYVYILCSYTCTLTIHGQMHTHVLIHHISCSSLLLTHIVTHACMHMNTPNMQNHLFIFQRLKVKEAQIKKNRVLGSNSVVKILFSMCKAQLKKKKV